MEQSEAAGRYWCYLCSKRVNPVREEVKDLNCPVCLTGFLELMEPAAESDDASPSDAIPEAVRGPPPDGTLNVFWNPEGGDDVDHGNEGNNDWDLRVVVAVVLEGPILE